MRGVDPEELQLTTGNSDFDESGPVGVGMALTEGLPEVDTVATGAQVRRGHFFAEWIGLALLPLALFRLYGIVKFYLLSGADPFIYIGYTFSTSDLVRRYGYPYYAVRFGLILPSVTFARLFGPIGGYFSLRWLLSFLTAAGVYFCFRRRYRWEIGAVGAIALLLNPIYIRALMTVYSTTVGVPALAMATALLLMPGSRRAIVVSRIAAGICLGFCFNSNPFTAMPIAFMMLAWVLARSARGWGVALRELGLVFAATVVVTLAGAVVYWLWFGDPDILTPSIDAARRLSSSVGYGNETDRRWLRFRPEIWLPPIASLLLSVVLRLRSTKSAWFERAAVAMPVAMWLSFVVHQFVLGSNTFELYYYTSYMVGPTAIALTMTVAVLSELASARSSRGLILLAAGVVLSVPILWTHLTPRLSVWMPNGVLPITALGVFLLLVSRRVPVLSWVAVATIVTTPFLLTLGSPENVPLSQGQPFRQEAHYAQVFNHYDDSKLDFYSIAAAFAQSVPRDGRQPGSVTFWVTPTYDVALLSQWTYLGDWNALQSAGSPAVPELDGSQVTQLVDRTPRFVIVMSTVESIVASGEAALKQLHLPIVRVTRSEFHSGTTRLYVSTIEFVPAACDEEGRGGPTHWRELQPCAAPD